MAHPVSILTLHPYNPFTQSVWAGLKSPITRAEVAAAIAAGRLRKEPVPLWNVMDKPPSREDHIERVAYLVLNKDPNPIEVDVGVPGMRHPVDWPIIDGNHRVAAAFYRHDPSVDAKFSGHIETIRERFGVDLSV